MSASSALTGKLQALGLTDNECKAYLTLLRTGPCTAVELSRESHLQRTPIYPLMVGLVSKGLVEQTIDRPKRYRPADVKHSIPELASRLRDQFTEIAKESEQLAGRLESLVPGTRKIRREEVRII